MRIARSAAGMLALIRVLSIAAPLLISTASRASSQKPETIRDQPIAFSALSAGNRFTCGISTDSIAYCWGFDNVGQLGIDEIVGRCAESIYARGACARAPVKIFGGHRFVSISTGFEHACAIDRAGDAYCWGENHFDQLGVPYVTDFCTHEGSHGEAPRPIACSRRPLRVQVGASFISIVTGEYFTCALDSSGRAWCWGGSPTPTKVPLDVPLATLSAGGNQVCGLTIDRGIRCWEWRNVLTDGATAPSAATIWTALTVGTGHACALDNGGEAYCWGNDADGALGIGRNDHDKHHDFPMMAVTGGHRFRSIVTGETQTCAIDATGALFCWGRVEDGLADDQCLDSNGISGTNDCITRPRAVHRKHRFRTVAIGARHQCGITTSGEVLCWGTNEAGQLGDGTLRATAGLTAVRTLGISPAQARSLDARTRFTRILRSRWLLVGIGLLVALYFARPALRAWWRAGISAPTTSEHGMRGGTIALGAVLLGWLIFVLSWFSIAASEPKGEIGGGLATLALLWAASTTVTLAAVGVVTAILTLRRHREQRAAIAALMLGGLTMLVGAVLAAMLFWPRER